MQLSLILPPLFLLVTGTTLNLYAQQLTDLKFAKPEAHILPAVKFFASLIFAALGKWKGPSVARPPTRRQQSLMALIGVLDASAYVCFCVGFALCGASLSSLVLAAAGQLFTALATRFVLKKRLSTPQVLAVSLVAAGLVLRILPSSYFGLTSNTRTTITSTIANTDTRGIVMITIAALLYSALGVAYELLVTAGAPPYPDILWHISMVGALGAGTYQALYVAPRASSLLAVPLTSPPMLFKLALFGTLFNIHMYTQSKVFKGQGALGVALVNAMRGAVIAAGASVLFCSPDRPKLCMNVQSGVSAVVTTIGGLAWVVAGARADAQKKKKEKEEVETKKDK